MNKEQLLKRKSEIAELLADETRSIDNLDELETELRDINEKSEAIEKRERLAEEARAINSGETAAQTVATFNGGAQTENRSEKQKEMEYRKAFMDYVLRGETIPTELPQLVM